MAASACRFMLQPCRAQCPVVAASWGAGQNVAVLPDLGHAVTDSSINLVGELVTPASSVGSSSLERALAPAVRPGPEHNTRERRSCDAERGAAINFDFEFASPGLRTIAAPGKG